MSQNKVDNSRMLIGELHSLPRPDSYRDSGWQKIIDINT